MIYYVNGDRGMVDKLRKIQGVDDVADVNEGNFEASCMAIIQESALDEVRKIAQVSNPQTLEQYRQILLGRSKKAG